MNETHGTSSPAEEPDKPAAPLSSRTRRNFLVRVAIAVLSLAVAGLAFLIKVIYAPVVYGPPLVEYGPPVYDDRSAPPPVYGPPPDAMMVEYGPPVVPLDEP